MFEYFPFHNLIQGFIVVVMIGVFYNVWLSARTYGGLIGAAIRLMGLGMMFISVAVIERLLANFGIVESTLNFNLGYDILTLLGLLFLAIGFSRLASVRDS